MTTTDPDNDGDVDTPGQPDIDASSPPLGLYGYPRPMKSVRQHKHKMRAPGTSEDAPPEIGRSLGRDRKA